MAPRSRGAPPWQRRGTMRESGRDRGDSDAMIGPQARQLSTPLWPRPQWRTAHLAGQRVLPSEPVAGAEATALLTPDARRRTRSASPLEQDYRRIMSPMSPEERLLEPTGPTQRVQSPTLTARQTESDAAASLEETAVYGQDATSSSGGLRRSRSIHSRRHLGTISGVHASASATTSSAVPFEPLLSPSFQDLGRRFVEFHSYVFSATGASTSDSIRSCVDCVIDSWARLDIADTSAEAEALRQTQHGPDHSIVPFLLLLLARAAALARGDFDGVDGAIARLRELVSRPGLGRLADTVDPDIAESSGAAASAPTLRPKRRRSLPLDAQCRGHVGSSSDAKRSKRKQERFFMPPESALISTTGIDTIATRIIYCDGEQWASDYRLANCLRNDSTVYCSAHRSGKQVEGMWWVKREKRSDYDVFRPWHASGLGLDDADRDFEENDTSEDDEDLYGFSNFTTGADSWVDPEHAQWKKSHVKRKGWYNVVTMFLELLPNGTHGTSSKKDESLERQACATADGASTRAAQRDDEGLRDIQERAATHLGGIRNNLFNSRPASNLQGQRPSLESSWVDWSHDPATDTPNGFNSRAGASANGSVKDDYSSSARVSKRQAPVTISKIVLKAPSSGFTVPVKRALVFASLWDPARLPEKPETESRDQYDRWGLPHTLPGHPTQWEFWEPCPVESAWPNDFGEKVMDFYHEMDQPDLYGLRFVEALVVDQTHHSITAELKAPVSARFVMVKLFSDIQFSKITLPIYRDLVERPLSAAARSDAYPTVHRGNAAPSEQIAQNFQSARDVPTMTEFRAGARARARVAERGQLRPRRQLVRDAMGDELVSDVSTTSGYVTWRNPVGNSSLTARGRALAQRVRHLAESEEAVTTSAPRGSTDLLDADGILTINDMMVRGLQARQRRGRQTVENQANRASSSTSAYDPLRNEPPTLTQSYETHMPPRYSSLTDPAPYDPTDHMSPIPESNDRLLEPSLNLPPAQASREDEDRPEIEESRPEGAPTRAIDASNDPNGELVTDLENDHSASGTDTMLTAPESHIPDGWPVRTAGDRQATSATLTPLEQGLSVPSAATSPADGRDNSLVRLATMTRRPVIDNSLSGPRLIINNVEADEGFKHTLNTTVDIQYIGFYGYMGARSFGSSEIR